jgi:hypothetical protein
MLKKLFLVATVVSAITISGTAAAHKVTHDSNVNVRYANKAFKGKVSSEKGKCRKGRTVTIFRLVDGERVRVARTRTGPKKKGFYKARVPGVETGEYFAVARRQALRKNRKHRHLCGRARSATMTITTHDSRITARYAKNAFEGKVSSKHDRCRHARTVKAFRLVDGKRTLVAEGTTAEDGAYSLPFANAPRGDYFAVVKREVLVDENRHSDVCKRDRSPTIKVKSKPKAAG